MKPQSLNVFRFVLVLIALLLCILVLAGGTVAGITPLKELAVAALLLAVAMFVP